MALRITQIGVRSEICENLGGRWIYCAAMLKIKANTVSYFFIYNTFSNTISYYRIEQGIEKNKHFILFIRVYISQTSTQYVLYTRVLHLHITKKLY